MNEEEIWKLLAENYQTHRSVNDATDKIMEAIKQAQLSILDRIEKSDSYNPNYTHPEVKDWLISKEELTRLRKELE